MQSYSFFNQTTPGADFIMFTGMMLKAKQEFKLFSCFGLVALECSIKFINLKTF
jgi:hypothetical protein